MSDYFKKRSIVNEATAIETIRQKSHALAGVKDLDLLISYIGDARIVMLGEASHGTHEYYTWRAHITKRLIKEKGFNFIAVEGDWPDCYRLNRYIKNYPGAGNSAVEVLHAFNRWPTWMWANWEIAALAGWLNEHNKTIASVDKKTGFYGLDVYSLWESMEAIMQYLKKTDPQALKVAEEAFNCFEPYRYGEGQSYAKATMFVPELCRDEVIDMLAEIQRKLPQFNTDHENVFNIEQNGIVAVNAEKYYRAMIRGGSYSWNIRDQHMADTLKRLLKFHGPKSKAIIWAHNTHIGDARATDMASQRMFNIGELARIQHYDKGVILVGFGSYKGHVIAGKNWGSKMQNMIVPEAKMGSWEYLLHQAGSENKLLFMSDLMDDQFRENYIGHRAIGVVYNPEQEQYGNYVPSILPMRYNAFIYLDETRGLHPMHIQPDGYQMPETYPFGV